MFNLRIIFREREREMPELSMTKPLSLQLIANFEPSPLHSIILQSANFSLRRKVFIHQVYWGRDIYICIYPNIEIYIYIYTYTYMYINSIYTYKSNIYIYKKMYIYIYMCTERLAITMSMFA